MAGAAIISAVLSSLAIYLLIVNVGLVEKLAIHLLVWVLFGFLLLSILWLDQRFRQAISPAPAPVEPASSPLHPRQRFLVRQGQKLLSVETKEIAWIHAEGKLCYCKTWDNHRYFIEYSLEELNEMLDDTQFFRINRAYIVQFKAIKNINPYFNSKLILQLHPATEDNDVIISKEKAADFKRWLGK